MMTRTRSTKPHAPPKAQGWPLAAEGACRLLFNHPHKDDDPAPTPGDDAAASGSPPQRRRSRETKDQRQERFRRERRAALSLAAKSKEFTAAGLPAADLRTAAGNREHQIDSVGGTKRARSLSIHKLIRGPQNTPVRQETCRRYEEMFHQAHGDLYRSPAWTPKVDQSYVSKTPTEGAANGKGLYARLVAVIGEEANAFLYWRIIENMDFETMERNGFGQNRHLSQRFIQAVDAASRFFLKVPLSPMVERMKKANSA